MNTGFYIFTPGREPPNEVWSWFERGASRVRSAFAKRMKFFEAKHVDTFYASDSRQPGRPLIIFFTIFY